jgi:glycosyl hydrolase family 113
VRLIALSAALVLAFVAIAMSRAPARDGLQRGFVLLGLKSDSYRGPGSDTALRRMAAEGADRVAIFSQWFVADPTASPPAPDPARTPSDASILHAMATARAAGLRVTLKPQVGIRTGDWIGAAHPSDPNAFWSGYRSMLLHYADLAQRGGASMLVVGTEMASLSGDETRWRELIGEVRARFHGDLTYAANYDEFERVRFWDALDYIGIDAYFPLADATDPSPTREQLAAAWPRRGYLDAIARVSGRTGKRVLFTELGYRSIRTAAVHPNVWQGSGVTDTRAQANAYEAFYAAVARQPWMAGIYWWAVNPDGSPPQDYDPTGKPAEAVVARESLRARLPW